MSVNMFVLVTSVYLLRQIPNKADLNFIRSYSYKIPPSDVLTFEPGECLKVTCNYDKMVFLDFVESDIFNYASKIAQYTVY